MRFKKGSKVEVLCKKEVPLGAWCCAEIISGNGHSYSVMYDGSLSMENEVFMDRVSRKAIRPCPPPVRSVENWAVGDVVEVLHQCSWKIATILKVLDGGRCLVRLLGSCQEFTVHQSKIRMRQTWKDERWIVFDKVKILCHFFAKLFSYYAHLFIILRMFERILFLIIYIYI